MKIAHIVPTTYMKFWLGRDYHMMLAHLADDPEYVKEANLAKGYKIMDNSVYELGESLTPEKLIEAAKKLNPSEIVVPDVLRDGAATLLSAYKYTAQLRQALPNVKLMVVPQGKTLEEWLKCYTELVKLPIDTVGINKFTHYYALGGRIKFCKMMKEEGLIKPNIEYHLLGLPEMLDEIKNQARTNPWIRGIDTCSIFLISKMHRRLKYVDHLLRPDEPMTFNDEYELQAAKVFTGNIKMVDKWLGPQKNVRLDY